MKEIYKFTIEYESVIETDTGEVLETKIIHKSDLKLQKSSKKEDNCNEPKLILEENKFKLNSAAIELMQLKSDDKIDIKYEDGNVPVIGTDEAFSTKGGNKLTKSNTVAYRGNKNSELSKYGKEFIIVKHPVKLGLFVLTSDAIKVEQLLGDENVNLDPIEDVQFDMSDFVDDKDSNITEIDSSFFKL